MVTLNNVFTSLSYVMDIGGLSIKYKELNTPMFNVFLWLDTSHA